MSSGAWSSAGYYVCSHGACSKKADPFVTDHQCCSRCLPARRCREEAARAYTGPGDWAHDYFETLMYPGVCDTCDEPPEAHPWIYDRHHGMRRPNPRAAN